MSTRKDEVGSMATIAATGATNEGDLSGAGGAVQQVGAPLAEDDARYERKKLLGEGGMGQVWLTNDSRIGRRVAMKTMRMQGAGADLLRGRFLREARVQGQLEHPSVVPVYDLGRDSEGESFFTMKRVRGATLADVIEGLAKHDQEIVAKYSQRRLLTAFSQVCLTIEFAHERGVIHRDLKPENLMLGDHGEVYVLDWGVARVLRDDLDEEGPSLDEIKKAALAAEPSQTGLVGTPGYMSVEQMNGHSVGPGADVFALGAILYELLTTERLMGNGPAVAKMSQTMDGVDVAAKIARLDRPIAPELADICVRATAHELRDRIASARELYTAIEKYLDGERDQQLRMQLAEKHLELSRAAMRASGDDVEAHKRALRETGRALALVPDHPEARAIILSLFASTPSALPPEVAATIEEDRAHQSRLTAKGGAAGMLSMLFFLPVMVLFGIRSWLGIGIFAAMALGAAAISFAAAKRKERSETLIRLVVVFNNVVFALCSGLFGPLVMVPTMVITNTVSFAMHLDGRSRMWAVVSACLAVAMPIALGAVGIVPSAYLPSGDGILLRPMWLALPPVATLLFILVGELIAIVNGARSVAQVRDALTIAERRLQMQRWQLQQFLPEEKTRE